MAQQKDIEFTYDDLDELFPIILGAHADFTAAYYNGNYSKSLEQAQQDKHAWILEGIGFQAGQRVLDIGCGWGPMLKAIKERGGEALGITLSPKQVAACQRSDLNAILLDWKTLDPAKFGRFDAIISIGAFEHFCSIEEYLNGQQEKIYDDFFKLCHDLLPAQGTLYLQTMIWGERTPWGDRDLTAADIERYMDLKAPKQSDARILGLVKAFFPGSWLPTGKAQIIKVAQPYFDLIKANDGRLDYIQTLTEWVKAWYAPKPGKTLVLMKRWPNYILKGKAYLTKMQCIREHAVREVFIRNIFGHQRMFFKKKT